MWRQPLNSAELLLNSVGSISSESRIPQKLRTARTHSYLGIEDMKALLLPRFFIETKETTSAHEKGRVVRKCFKGLPLIEKEPNAPLVHALKVCAGDENVAAFHFPGHRRGFSSPTTLLELLGHNVFAHDLPELPQLDNLHAPETVIKDAQNKAAMLFGADSTWFLVNGSTCGIQAAVMATCKPGDYLILPRNCHMSATSAMVLSGALPEYVLPVYDCTWGIAHGVVVASIEAAIAEVTNRKFRIGAVLIVSPTYYGVCSPVKEIAEVCHRYGIPLIVDEAHGGHFRFHSALPKTALQQGADISVQSSHKVLCSLTQSAMLHVNASSRVSRDRISKCLSSLQTSSPSYILLASLDAARAEMHERGQGLFDAALKLAAKARSLLQLIPRITVLDVPGMDELRLTVGLWQLGITGVEADEFLMENNKVIAELPSLHSLTFAVSTGTTNDDINSLVRGIEALSCNGRFSCDKEAIPLGLWNQMPEVVLSPRESFYSETERVNIENALGRASGEIICPYPPGIPLVFPGEVICEEALKFLSLASDSRITICGASDPSLSTLLVHLKKKI